VRLRENLPGDFIDCIRKGRRTCAPVDIAHRSTTLCSIAAIGMQVRRKVTWDGKREQFVGDEEANRLRARHARAPWGIERLGVVECWSVGVLECWSDVD
jgi:myo-inositol 2-dehydrogenase/D-chiro-inositol 1-dehydrogenase